MLKYIDLIKQSRSLLKESGIESYVLDTEILIQNSFDLTKEELFLSYNDNVNLEQHSLFQHLLARRQKREPISHIIGKREFWSLDFKVNNNTLDPRADTETLVSAVLDNYKNTDINLDILDLGTGSGCILLSLLSELKNAKGIGVDKVFQTALMAKENCKQLGFDNRCNFIVSKWSSAIDKKFDLIVSNPPYIKSDEIGNLSPEVKEFDPINALDGGQDGLDCYKEIAQNAKLFLKKDGLLFLEIGYNQENDVINIFNNNSFNHLNFYKDLSGKIRCLSFQLC